MQAGFAFGVERSVGNNSMNSKDCIFCKIINKEIPAKIIAESDDIFVIQDLHPKAPIHYLILPKKHIVNINYLDDKDLQYMTEIAKMTRDLAKEIQQEKGLTDPLAFNLLSNNEAAAGQSVFHMHFHFISGKNLY